MHPDWDIIIIGAGIAGLTAAATLAAHGRRVLVLESSSRVGGALCTEQRDGFRCEWGPHTFLPSATALREVAGQVGLAGQIAATAPAAAQRYIWWDDALRPLPMTPGALLRSPLLSWRGIWQLLREPWIRSVSPPHESLGAFITRRCGTECCERLADPFVSGIFAGDVDALEAATAFPQLLERERTHGSLLRALRARATTAAPHNHALYSFAGGMQTLSDALAARLTPAPLCHTTIHRITRSDAGHYTVQLSTPQYTGAVSAPTLICAAPTHTAAALLAGIAPQVSTALAAIDYAPIAVVQLGYHQVDALIPQGFGFLTPRRTNRSILGALFTSRLFPERAPPGTHLLTVFIGGARQPALALQSPDALAALARREIGTLLRVPEAAGCFSAVRVHPHAIPQYTIGHGDRIRQLATALRALPGLYCTGNYIDGTAVGATMAHARGLAQRIVYNTQREKLAHDRQRRTTVEESADAQ